jgi:hypothetical protein
VLTVTLPKKAAPKPASKPAPPPQDDSLDALYDLAQQGEDLSRQTADSPKCPKCFAEMSADAVLCTNCGFDRRTGKAIQPQVERAGKAAKPGKSGMSAKKQVEDKMAPQGSFMKGLVASAVGAAVGGVAWFGIAWAIGYEFSFIAILVGILAGVGMQWGHEGYSTLGGWVACGTSLLAMLLAKAAVIMIVVLPALRAEGDSLGDDTEHDVRVVEMLAHDQLKAMHVKPEDATVEQEKVAYAAAKMQIKKMSKKEYDAAIKRADEKEKLDELIGMEAEEIMRGMPKPNNMKEGFAALAAASKQARAKVEAMTPAQREAEIKRLGDAETRNAEIDRQRAQNDRAAENGDDSSSGSSAAKTAGIVVLLLLVFGWKSALFMVLGLGAAYKTASGSVSG